MVKFTVLDGALASEWTDTTNVPNSSLSSSQVWSEPDGVHVEPRDVLQVTMM
jgi:hypothetical protein